MDASLKIYTLGSVAIVRDGLPVTGFESRKAEALLLYLACTGQPQPREFLAEMLWGERAQGLGMTNLRRVLSGLRQQLAPYLDITRQTVAFTPDVWLDVAELEAALNADAHLPATDRLSRSAAQRLAKAVTLYRGDFLTGFYLSDSPAFEDWALLERERLQRRVVDALDQLVVTALEQGNYAEGLAHATRLLQLDPLREAAHRQMMTMLAYTGQRRAALAQYETCRRVLGQELDVAPDDETDALFRKIQAGELEKTAHESGDNLPVQPTPFVGRSVELAQIAERIDDPTCRLLTLVGPGGIGKTRLAIQAASLKRDDFAHGVCFVPLAALNSPDLLSGAMIDALKLSVRGRESPLTQLLNTLRPKELLFVLDNFEHLLENASLLSNILSIAPHVKFLITSRERLNLREEWLFEVQGMDFPNESVKEGSDQYSAVQLFTQSARRIQANFSLTKDLAAVLHICQRVEGMPLGIELAAAWLQTMSCRQIARQIDGSLDFLTTTLRNLPERHRSLRALFEHSWQLLSAAEQDVFKRLAVFRGGFELAAAQRVSGATPSVLAALIEKSMVRRHSIDRHEMHELLRQFAQEKLAEAGEVDAVRNGHLTYFLSLAEEAESNLDGTDQVEWLSRLDSELDNIRAALRWLFEQPQAELALRFGNALWQFWDVRSYLSEGRNWLAQALALPGGSSVLRGQAYYNAATLARKQGDYGAAQALYEQGLALNRSIADQRGVAYALIGLGIGSFKQSDYARANECHTEALAIFRALNDRTGISLALNNLATVAQDQGHYTIARPLYEESLAIRRTLGNQRDIADSVYNLGMVAQDVSDYDAAQALYQESLALFTALGEKRSIADTLYNLGTVAAEQHDSDTAHNFLERSLAVRRECNDRRGGAFPLITLSELAIERHDYEEARALLVESLLIFYELGEKRNVSHVLAGLAEVATGQGQSERAAKLFGGVDALRDAIGMSLPPSQQPAYKRAVAAARAQIDDAAFARAHDLGAALTFDQMLSYALNMATLSLDRLT